MAEMIETNSPLDKLGITARTSDSSTASLSERKYTGKLNLRGNAENSDFLAAVKSAVGADLPTVPNTTATRSGGQILWLAPDEWMITTEPGQEAQLADALRQGLSDMHYSLVDVTDNATILRLSGKDARRILMKGCALDLHPRSFAAGQCAQSFLGRANATIVQLDDEPSYDIYVRNSFAEYMWTWAMDAGLEFAIVPSDS